MALSRKEYFSISWERLPSSCLVGDTWLTSIDCDLILSSLALKKLIKGSVFSSAVALFCQYTELSHHMASTCWWRAASFIMDHYISLSTECLPVMHLIAWLCTMWGSCFLFHLCKVRTAFWGFFCHRYPAVLKYFTGVVILFILYRGTEVPRLKFQSSYDSFLLWQINNFW